MTSNTIATWHTNTQPGFYTVDSTTGYSTGVTSGYRVPVPTQTAPGFTEPFSAPRPGKLRRVVRDLWARMKSERGGTMPILPTLAGGSQDLETEFKVEAKKKITIERKVGVPRDKGSGMETIHKGTVELVRTLEGTDEQMATIGLKVSPKDGSGHVEVPIEDLRRALDDLDPKDPS